MDATQVERRRADKPWHFIEPGQRRTVLDPDKVKHDLYKTHDDPDNDNQNDGGFFGERFVVQWENGKQSRETPQSILEILVGGDVEGELEQEKQQKEAQDKADQKSKEDAKKKKANLKQKQAEKAQAKKKKQQTELESDPLLGRTVREFVQLSDDPNDEVEVTGTVIRVFKKKSGKGKGQRRYEIKYDDEDLDVELPNITETRQGVMKMLIPED